MEDNNNEEAYKLFVALQNLFEGENYAKTLMVLGGFASAIFLEMAKQGRDPHKIKDVFFDTINECLDKEIK